MEAYNMKMPGIYAVYALTMALLGQSVEGIHAGLLVVNLLAAFLLFVLGRRLFSPLVGCVAGASFATMSLSPSVLGPFAHAEQFVVLPVLLGAVVLHRALVTTKRRRLFLSGTLMGTGFIILQLGAPFIAFGFSYLLYFESTREPSAWKSLGAKVILVHCGSLFAVGGSLHCHAHGRSIRYILLLDLYVCPRICILDQPRGRAPLSPFYRISDWQNPVAAVGIGHDRPPQPSGQEVRTRMQGFSACHSLYSHSYLFALVSISANIISCSCCRQSHCCPA